MAYAVSEGRQWSSERALDDQVVLQTSLRVSSTSTTPTGGSVDFYASVRNLGQRPVSVLAVDIDTSRLLIASVSPHGPAVAPGETITMPLSVLLDCSDSTDAGSTDRLRGEILATASNGRERRVDATFDAATAVTGIAATLCRLHPDLRNVELDGPVL